MIHIANSAFGRNGFRCYINSLSLLLLVLLFLIVKPSVEERNWKSLWSKCPWILCHRNLCASLFHDECALSCASPQFTAFVRNLHFMLIGFQKRQISRTMTFCLHKANAFVDRYKKTTTDFTQFALCDGRCKSNYRWMSFIFTDIESLTDRWVLSNTPMKTIRLQCFANGLNH